MAKYQVYTMSVARVYSCYVTKAEKKGRTKTEVDEIQSKLAEMKYQIHKDQPIEYLEDTIVLQGVAEE